MLQVHIILCAFSFSLKENVLIPREIICNFRQCHVYGVKCGPPFDSLQAAFNVSPSLWAVTPVFDTLLLVQDWIPVVSAAWTPGII